VRDQVHWLGSFQRCRVLVAERDVIDVDQDFACTARFQT